MYQMVPLVIEGVYNSYILELGYIYIYIYIYFFFFALKF